MTVGSGRVELTYESSADDIKNHKTEICRNDETAICRNNKNQERQGPGLYKARVVYGAQGVEAIEYAPYKMKEIHSLKVVEDNNIDYTYKSTDRSALNALVAQKGDCDEIIIVKNGLITDTSFTNLALFDGNNWLTPKHPLLHGTKRAQLLEAGIIEEAELTPEDLKKAEKVSLFNAMIDFGEREVTEIFLPDSAD